MCTTPFKNGLLATLANRRLPENDSSTTSTADDIQVGAAEDVSDAHSAWTTLPLMTGWTLVLDGLLGSDDE